MLYVFVSSATDAREKVHTAMRTVSSEIPTRVTSDEIGECDVVLLAQSQGLFAVESCVFFDGALAVKDARDRVVSSLGALASSANHFFIFEPSLDAATTKALEKHATQMHVEKRAAKSAERSGGFFSVSDALGTHDRRKLWAEVVHALSMGAAPEEVHGILWWGVKNMLLARDAKNAAEAGLNPFVFGKAKTASKNFKPGELERIAEELSTLLYRTRRKNADAGAALEHFALSF